MLKHLIAQMIDWYTHALDQPIGYLRSLYVVQRKGGKHHRAVAQ